MNGVNGHHRPDFKLEDFPVDGAHRRMRVAVIGCGFSGIISGVRLQQRMSNCDFKIYEKNGDVGGTWYENKYPGLACDIPAHCYALTFEPNPSWSNFYAYGPEIHRYLQHIANKWKLQKYIQFRHRLEHAEWNEEAGTWRLRFDILNEAGDKVSEKIEEADIVIQAMGVLSRWDWPNIPGLKDFKGRLLHSAAYESTAQDETGRTVAVIGSGSSSIQIVPNLQPHAKKVDNYVRGKTWIASPMASTELLKRQPDGRNYTFTEEEKEQFTKDPEAYNRFRHNMESELNSVHEVTQRGSNMQVGAVEAFKEMMRQKLAKKPEIFERIVPTFPVACRRLTPGPGYLESLVEDNVEFVPTGIKRFTETGIEAEDGTHRTYDTIVCATGFDTSFRPRIQIIGRDGVNMQDKWSERPKHYLSLAAGKEFPNWFIIGGPNSAVGSGSLLVLYERVVDYIVEVIKKLQREEIRAISVKNEAVNDFMEYVDAYFPKTVYSEKCRSWYKAGKELGPVFALWPGSCIHALKTLKHPRWEDFDYVPLKQSNRFAWLGNGWSLPELTEGSDRAFYLKEVDIPPVPK